MGRVRDGVAPGGLGHPVGLEHGLGPEPARGERHGRRTVRREFMAEGEGHPVHRGLRQVVEERDAVVGRVVLVRPVGHLDDQPARCLDQQRQREVTGDGVGVDGQPQGVQSGVERRFPHRLVPLDLRAPDVVHQDVQGSLLARDPGHERPDPVGQQMVDLDGDAPSARRVDQGSGLLDRLGPVHLGALGAAGTAGHVHGRPGGAELDGDASPAPAGATGDERHTTGQAGAGVLPVVGCPGLRRRSHTDRI
ncbi:hypothetical protein DER30_1483 [Streptomyces sp. HB202]|nr:hypothetical protein DER30_1483 [Streptomyces sp. HB202]